MMTDNIALYVHIPFCKRKCFYCDFCSQTFFDFEKYITALKNEIEYYAPFFKDSSVSTIFFGGGTPSVLPLKYLKEIMLTLEHNFNLQCIEQSIECNPESVCKEKLEQYRELSFDRVSIGVQSLDDVVLQKIGRLHNSKIAQKAVDCATDIFDNVSVDLMTGLPSQSDSSILDTVDCICSYPIKHISCYQLILQQGSKLHDDVMSGKESIPDDDTSQSLWDLACEQIEKHTFKRYEVSNFALSNYECKHNLVYWQRENYLGLGASAHSMVDNIRFSNFDSVAEYIEKANQLQHLKSTMNSSKNILLDIVTIKRFAKQVECLSSSDITAEQFMLGLRLTDGVPAKLFENKQDFLAKYKEFFVSKNEKIALNNKGFNIMNSLLVELL